MRRLLIVSILTGVTFLLVQCGKQSTPPDQSDISNSITIETDESATSSYAGNSAFWAEYRCLESATDSTCDVRFLEIGDADGMLYQIYIDSTYMESESQPILLSGNGYDLAVTIKSSQTGKDGSSGSGGKRFLTLTIQPTQIPRLPYPPCYSTTTLSQSLTTRHYTLDSARVSRDDLLTWITYRSGSTQPQFSLVAWYSGVASTGDTTECYLRFSAADTSGLVVKARLGFNLAPLASVIGQKTPCECVSTLRVLRPQNNWHSGFEVAQYARTMAEESSSLVEYIMPLADGNYWVYSESCPDLEKSTTGNMVGDSVCVELLRAESCKKLYQVKTIRDPDFWYPYPPPIVVSTCGDQILVDGVTWVPPVPIRNLSHTVPAGTFDSCYFVLSTFWYNGQDQKIYAKGVGLIEHRQIYSSAHSGESYNCTRQLLRYRVASE